MEQIWNDFMWTLEYTAHSSSSPLNLSNVLWMRILWGRRRFQTIMKHIWNVSYAIFSPVPPFIFCSLVFSLFVWFFFLIRKRDKTKPKSWRIWALAHHIAPMIAKRTWDLFHDLSPPDETFIYLSVWPDVHFLFHSSDGTFLELKPVPNIYELTETEG